VGAPAGRAASAAAAPSRATCSSRLGGAAAAGRRRHFFLADCCSQIRGATMELGRSMMMRRRASAASYGVIDNRSENLQH